MYRRGERAGVWKNGKNVITIFKNLQIENNKLHDRNDDRIVTKLETATTTTTTATTTIKFTKSTVNVFETFNRIFIDSTGISFCVVGSRAE